MHKQRLAVIIAAGIGVMATLLPWLTDYVNFLGVQGSESYAGISKFTGILVFLACGGAIALSVMGDREKSIDPDKVKFVAIAGAIAFVFALLFWLGNVGDTGYVAGLGGRSIGFGVYLSMLAGLAIVAVPFVIKDSGEFSMPTKDSIKEEFNEIKDN